MEELWIARHGATEWSENGRHTGGDTDLDLLPEGEERARALGRELRGETFDLVVSSPLRRALRTAQLAGFSDRVHTDHDLVEFRYGDYEGRTTADIRLERPGWNFWVDGCPNGETLDEVVRRVDRALKRLEHHNMVLMFAHGHTLRVVAARFLGLTEIASRLGGVAAGGICILAHERDLPVIKIWNRTDQAG